MPAPLMTVYHRLTSATRCVLRASGVVRAAATGSVPRSANRSITFEYLVAVCSAATSFSETSLGKPLGAHLACHADTSKPGIAPLSSVGKSGTDETLNFVVTA